MAHQRHGKKVAKDELSYGGSRWGEVERTELFKLRQNEGCLAGADQPPLWIHDNGYGMSSFVPKGRTKFEQLRGLAALAEDEDDVARPNSADIAVESVLGRKKKRPRPGTAQRHGNFLRDDAALAHAGAKDHAIRRGHLANDLRKAARVKSQEQLVNAQPKLLDQIFYDWRNALSLLNCLCTHNSPNGQIDIILSQVILGDKKMPSSAALYEGPSIETDVVAQGFSDAATTYDAWSQPLAFVAEKLVNFLPKEASRVLDVGCGTGLMTQHVKEKYPNAHVLGIDPAIGMVELCRQKWKEDPKTQFVVSQIEKFSSPRLFDLIVGTCSFQWFSDKTAAVRAIAASMVKGGTLAAAIPVGNNFSEFYESYTAATGSQLPWSSSLYVDWRPIFESNGLSIDRWSVEEIPILVPEPSYILDFMRGIGTLPSNLRGDSPESLSCIKRLTEYYQNHFAGTVGVRMTWCILYCTCVFKSISPSDRR